MVQIRMMLHLKKGTIMIFQISSYLLLLPECQIKPLKMFLEKSFSRYPKKVKKWHEMITQYLPVILPSYKPGLMIYQFKVAYLKLLTSYEFANFDYIKFCGNK